MSPRITRIDANPSRRNDGLSAVVSLPRQLDVFVIFICVNWRDSRAGKILWTVQHHSRGRFTGLELRAHFLDLRRLLFELRREDIDLPLLFLVLAMLLEELVE